MNANFRSFSAWAAAGALALTGFAAMAQPPDQGPGDERRGPHDKPPRFEEIDANGDGKLSVDEAKSLPPFVAENFARFDDNSDGYLTPDELPRPRRDGERGDRRARMQELDVNNDGKLSFEEAAKLPQMNQERFAQMDTNGDGFLSPEDRPERHGPDRMGPPPFEELDTDGSGGLSLDEVKNMPRMSAERFAQLDADNSGELSKEELPRPPRHRGGPEGEGPGGDREFRRGGPGGPGGGPGPRGDGPPPGN